MKQIVNGWSIIRTFETKDNSVENIKKEIGKYIDEMSDYISEQSNCENFQISELNIKRFDDKLVFTNGDHFSYVPELESYKKSEKRYCIKIIANVIQNISD